MVKHKDPQLHAHIKTRLSYTIPLFLATHHYLTCEKYKPENTDLFSCLMEENVFI